MPETILGMAIVIALAFGLFFFIRWFVTKEVPPNVGKWIIYCAAAIVIGILLYYLLGLAGCSLHNLNVPVVHRG